MCHCTLVYMVYLLGRKEEGKMGVDGAVGARREGGERRSR
jgi:hypothetical protein